MSEEERENQNKKVSIELDNQFDVSSILGEIYKLFEDSRFDLGDGKETEIYFRPEEKYVRRSIEDFKAGAEPVKSGEGSHRMSRTSIMMTPEMKTAVQILAKRDGLDQMKWMRAAIRFALRSGDDFDPSAELGSEFSLVFLKSDSPPEP